MGTWVELRREVRELKDQLARARSTLKETERDLSKARDDRRILKAHVLKDTADSADIGRASCMEKVYISVVAVSLKKNFLKQKNAKKFC